MKTLRIPHRFFKWWNSDELPEEVDKPLSIENDCPTVFDNHSQVMIELQHGVKLILVFYEAYFLCNDLKFVHICTVNAFSNQFTDHLLKIYPP